MDFFKWSNNDPLKINKFGIPEPISSKIFYPDILLVPLVGYDNDLNRLGYGGGFYDRYIEKIEKTKKIIKTIKSNWKRSTGIHTHDNMGKALENSVAAINNSVDWIDCTVTGMGRGPGNTKTENLILIILK